jgi:hypothetical protein
VTFHFYFLSLRRSCQVERIHFFRREKVRSRGTPLSSFVSSVSETVPLFTYLFLLRDTVVLILTGIIILMLFSTVFSVSILSSSLVICEIYSI